jgi:hypothetical protein
LFFQTVPSGKKRMKLPARIRTGFGVAVLGAAVGTGVGFFMHSSGATIFWLAILSALAGFVFGCLFNVTL